MRVKKAGVPIPVGLTNRMNRHWMVNWEEIAANAYRRALAILDSGEISKKEQVTFNRSFVEDLAKRIKYAYDTLAVCNRDYKDEEGGGMMSLFISSHMKEFERITGVLETHLESKIWDECLSKDKSD